MVDRASVFGRPSGQTQSKEGAAMMDRICPQCKRGDLVERLNKKTGQSFYGCNRYPDCKFAVASLDRLQRQQSAELTAATSNAGEGELAAAVRELASAIRTLAASSATPDEFKPDEGTP
jgi:ssDNA-binding Zn-finger/Zn-ribbon topoisomerase 1